MADLDDLKQEVKKLRGEMELRLHLASLEAKDEWNALEGKWERFSSRAGLEDSAGNVGEALELLGDELKRGYRRLLGAIRD
ncbi:hypothetical protein [Elongatibacter sediminis]|uniref:Uncharacterized protein n=1 Tax=Elongatibacter sediminis TaxID=3119006 RepID=A0AAW9R8Y3_9GAMM